jgi:hypothetical protein
MGEFMSKNKFLESITLVKEIINKNKDFLGKLFGDK